MLELEVVALCGNVRPPVLFKQFYQFATIVFQPTQSSIMCIMIHTEIGLVNLIVFHFPPNGSKPPASSRSASAYKQLFDLKGALDKRRVPETDAPVNPLAQAA